MAKDVKLTAAEQAASNAFERSPSNIKELKAEIAKATNPTIKNILEGYLASLQGGK